MPNHFEAAPAKAKGHATHRASTGVFERAAKVHRGANSARTSHINLIGKRENPVPEGRGLTFWGQWAAAMGMLTLLLCALAVGKTGEFETQYRILALFTLLGSVPAYSLLRVYHKHHGYLVGAGRLLAGWLVLLSGLTVMAFLTKTSELFSREVIIIWACSGYVIQACLFLPLHAFSRRYHNKLQSARTSLIIGTGDLAQELADKLVRKRSEPLVGLVAADDHPHPDDGLYPLIGNLSHLRELICEHRIRRLYIALPVSAAEQIEGLYIDLLDANVDVVWIPDLQSLKLLNHSVSDIDGLAAINLNESPLTSYPTAALTKAALDRSVALLAILLLSPLLLGTALAVKLSSPGPALFKQKRHGWNGKVIKVWKFRSMRMHADTQVKQATREDPRITRVGRFIRRTSIDELPQAWRTEARCILRRPGCYPYASAAGAKITLEGRHPGA